MFVCNRSKLKEIVYPEFYGMGMGFKIDGFIVIVIPRVCTRQSNIKVLASDTNIFSYFEFYPSASSIANLGARFFYKIIRVINVSEFIININKGHPTGNIKKSVILYEATAETQGAIVVPFG